MLASMKGRFGKIGKWGERRGTMLDENKSLFKYLFTRKLNLKVSTSSYNSI